MATPWALYNQDCLVGMQEYLLDDSVDVCVTSPPYNIGTRYASYSDKGPRTEYLESCRQWGHLIQRKLHPDGSFFLNVGSKPSDPLVAIQILEVMLELGWKLQNQIHWIKSLSIQGAPCIGHVKPLNTPRYLNDSHEFIFHLTRTGRVPLDRRALAVGVPYADKSNLTRGTRGTHGDIRCAGNVWYEPYDTIQRRVKNRPHPATFPLRIPDRCIRLHGLSRCDLVLDPFCGLGSTAVVCQALEKPFVGFELDPEYFQFAHDRLQLAV